MPEDSFEEKTEQPTPKRLSEARERGSVAKSMELNSSVLLMASATYLYFAGPALTHNLTELMRSWFMQTAAVRQTGVDLQGVYVAGLHFLARAIGPFLLFVTVLGLAVNIAQIGFLLTTKPLEPDLAKLSPLKGISNLVSIRGLVETVKGILKIVVVGIISYMVVKGDFNAILGCGDFSVGQMAVFTGTEMYKIVMILCLVLLAVAILDYLYQRWNHTRSLRMTKQEIKEERKQMEGDPMVKARIRSLQREMARRRMMDEVPKATVVVTNPTFIAIALRYDADMSAPKVVAKGKRAVAERIRETARAHGIPIVEDKPLARAMYDVVEPGAEVPQQFFSAVAEVLAYVYRLQKKQVA